MKKLLIYVDAENISKEEFSSIMPKIKSVANNELIVGKFYGKFSEVTGLMPLCFAEGFEFSETSSLVYGQKKNVTDMKISVDCVSDVFTLFRGEVSRVVILSKDCDFVPIVYKLLSAGINTYIPLYSSSNLTLTAAELEKTLITFGYDPMETDDWFKAQVPIVKKMLQSCYDVDVVKTFFDKKKKRFLSDLREMGYSDTSISSLNHLVIDQFSLLRVFELLGIRSNCEQSLLIVDLWTRKMFGKSFEQKQLHSKVNRFLKEVKIEIS